MRIFVWKTVEGLRDWKLHNNIIDLLSSDKVGFGTDGSEMSADY